MSAIKLSPCWQNYPGEARTLSHILSPGGCDVGLKHPDKVLGNPGKEAWEEVEGGGRRDPAAGAAQPAQEALPGMAKEGLRQRTGFWLPDSEAVFSERGGRAPSWSLARVLPGEDQDVPKGSSAVT